MRLLFEQEWFEPVSSEGQYETEFEDIIKTKAGSLFPDYHLVSFKKPVDSEDGKRIPDFALIERNYRCWWVVEVEMGHHSLNSHVIPQVEVFSRGRYGLSHCDYLLKKCTALQRPSIVDMIKGAQPRVLVIVNRPVPDWIDALHKLDCFLAVIEVYRSSRNNHILRMNGDYPSVSDANVVSMCRLDSAMPRLLEIDSPAALGVNSGQQMLIRFHDGMTTWSRIDAQGKVWLNPSGSNPLSTGQDYLILRDSDGRTSFTVS